MEQRELLGKKTSSGVLGTEAEGKVVVSDELIVVHTPAAELVAKFLHILVAVIEVKDMVVCDVDSAVPKKIAPGTEGSLPDILVAVFVVWVEVVKRIELVIDVEFGLENSLVAVIVVVDRVVVVDEEEIGGVDKVAVIVLMMSHEELAIVVVGIAVVIEEMLGDRRLVVHAMRFVLVEMNTTILGMTDVRLLDEHAILYPVLMMLGDLHPHVQDVQRNRLYDSEC